jgi:hypothetical protein
MPCRCCADAAIADAIHAAIDASQRRRHFIIAAMSAFIFISPPLFATLTLSPTQLRYDCYAFRMPRLPLPYYFDTPCDLFSPLPAAFHARYFDADAAIQLSPPALFATIADADAISPFHASFHAILRSC